MLAVIEPTLRWGASELGVFLLANVIIFWICFPKVWRDIKRWRAEA